MVLHSQGLSFGWVKGKDNSIEPFITLSSSALPAQERPCWRAGRRVARVGDVVDLEALSFSSGPRCAAVAGFSVFAGVCVPAHDRMRLEPLARYAGRPPVATERLSVLPDGRLLYRLRHRWRDGTTHMVFESHELVERLAALEPPPKCTLIRYHGVLAPSAAFTPLIIPESKADATHSHPGCSANNEELTADTENVIENRRCRPRKYAWAELLRRVFSIEVLRCACCSGRMRILCAINPPRAIRQILDCLGLPSRSPSMVPAILAPVNHYTV
jgi:hypothetical protein